MPLRPRFARCRECAAGSNHLLLPPSRERERFIYAGRRGFRNRRMPAGWFVAAQIVRGPRREFVDEIEAGIPRVESDLVAIPGLVSGTFKNPSKTGEALLFLPLGSATLQASLACNSRQNSGTLTKMATIGNRKLASNRGTEPSEHFLRQFR